MREPLRLVNWLRMFSKNYLFLQAEFILDHRWDAHEEALALCRQSQLEQTSYFLQRDLTFMREVFFFNVSFFIFEKML